MTEHIEEIFTLLGETDGCEAAVKVALSSMTGIVKKLNKTLTDLASNNQLGFDVSVRFSERTNEYFIKLLRQWLVSDSVASYFVFDLGGFEFLLDTIGVGSEADLRRRKSSDDNEELKEVDMMIDTSSAKEVANHDSNQFAAQSGTISSLAGSDLAQFLESRVLELHQPKTST